jgi:hypothetical protein
MYKDNAQAIYNILNALVATTKLTDVYNYDVKQVDSYPFAKVSVMDGDSDFFDTTENEMISNYRVSIIHQNRAIETIEPVMRELVDEVLLELNQKTNITLSGTVVYMKVSNIAWGWSELNETVRICDIFIEVKENI